MLIKQVIIDSSTPQKLEVRIENQELRIDLQDPGEPVHCHPMPY